MFKDADKELARLEAALLETEEESCEEAEEYPQEEYEEDYCDEEPEGEDTPPEYFYEDTRPAQDPGVYQNYSNDYGRELRNYATGYRAYNSDDCDEDLEEFSQEVYEAQEDRGNTGLLITACVLATVFGSAVLFIVLKYLGVL